MRWFWFFSLKITVQTSATTFGKNEKKIGRTGQTSKEPLTLDNNIVLIKHCFHLREKINLHFAARALLYSYFNIAYLYYVARYMVHGTPGNGVM